MTFSRVSDADIKKYADAIIAFVNQKNFDAVARKKLIGILAQYPPSTLIKMAEYKPVLIKFFQNDKELAEKWAKILEEQHLYSGDIKTMHGKPYAIFDRLRGNYYFNLWKNSSHNQTDLNKACDNHSFEALVARSNDNAEKIKNDKDLNNSAKEQLFKDLEILSDFYWIPGTIHAALLLTDIANFYTDKTNNEAALSRLYYDAALDFFLTAKELLELNEQHELNDIGTKLTEYIYQGRDLKTISNNQFDSLLQAQSFFCNKLHLNPTDEHFHELAAHAHTRTSAAKK